MTKIFGILFALVLVVSLGLVTAAPVLAAASPSLTNIPQVAAGWYHTVGLKTDGTVVAVGYNYYGQCNIGNWRNITQVAANGAHTVGLCSNGTVVAVGNNEKGQCNVGGWRNITQVATGCYHTMGRKSDGTVVAVGDDGSGQCNVGNWTNITQVAAGWMHTVGLKSDGTVVAVGYNYYGQCNVGNWTGITQVATGGYHTVGRKSDGTVVAMGDNSFGQCNVGGWMNITQVAAGWVHTVGLKSDGTVVAMGDNSYGQCHVGGWILKVPVTYTLSISSTAGGSVATPGVGTFIYPVGMVVSLVAIPATGYRFLNWAGDVGTIANVNAAATTITMNADYSIMANFEAIPSVQYDLTISSTAGGDVTVPGEGTFTYDEGTVVNLVATPATGYGFVKWGGDVGTIANVNVNAATTTITMQGDYKISAQFMAGVKAARTETVTNGTVDAMDEAKTKVDVTGTATVTVARYEDNPGGPPPTGSSSLSSLAKYIDVFFNDTTEVTETEIKLYYTDAEVKDFDEQSLRLFWWSGTAWVQCSNNGVNTASTNGYSGYMWAVITDDTTPSLDDLQGTPWGGYGHPTEKGICFVATAAYGTDTAKEIDILREFRDAVLLPNALGAMLVSFYYETSPPIANFISQHEVLRTTVKVAFVDPIVKILNWSHDLWSARG